MPGRDGRHGSAGGSPAPCRVLGRDAPPERSRPGNGPSRGYLSVQGGVEPSGSWPQNSLLTSDVGSPRGASDVAWMARIGPGYLVVGDGSILFRFPPHTRGPTRRDRPRGPTGP